MRSTRGYSEFHWAISPADWNDNLCPYLPPGGFPLGTHLLYKTKPKEKALGFTILD